MTFGEGKKELIELLTPLYGPGEASPMACMVIEKLTGLPRAMQHKLTYSTIPNAQLETLKGFGTALLEHRPVQYVLEEAWFLNRRFYVNESVLIPRPETEELVMLAIETIGQKEPPQKPISILDIGTGSGCIAISLALASNKFSVTGIDISPEALGVATKNSDALGAKVHWQKTDFLDPKQWEPFAGMEAIVANPPYIPLAEKSVLDKNVTAWEPGLALFTPNDDPIIFYKAIAAFCQKYPLPHRVILLEGHQKFMGDLHALFSPLFGNTTIRKDINGNERLLIAHN